MAVLTHLPTGTGKTLVALHIVFWFHKSNEEQAVVQKHLGGPHILYCGPSNKSVDVLAGAEAGHGAGLLGTAAHSCPACLQVCSCTGRES